MKTGSRRIYIVDDHPVVRQGYTNLISSAESMEVCGEASTAAEAITEVPHLKPDLVLVDIALPGMDGIELTKHLKALVPEIPILIVSAHEESLYAERALRAGAGGYLMKHEAASVIIEAIWRILSGQMYLSDRASSWLLQHRIAYPRLTPEGDISTLSDRELEVFRQIGAGYTSREIAQNLGLSIKTIETHRENIKSKLGLRTANQLVQRAVLWIGNPEH